MRHSGREAICRYRSTTARVHAHTYVYNARAQYKSLAVKTGSSATTVTRTVITAAGDERARASAIYIAARIRSTFKLERVLRKAPAATCSCSFFNRYLRPAPTTEWPWQLRMPGCHTAASCACRVNDGWRAAPRCLVWWTRHATVLYYCVHCRAAVLCAIWP